MTHIKNILKNIGLTDKESRVYLSCLELSHATVHEIGKKAQINRVTAYHILEKLLEKGLVNLSPVHGIKYFEAIDPEIVARKIRRNLSEFEDMIPDLKRLKGDAAAPKIRYFEGIEGIKALYEDSLKSTSEILSYANSTDIRELWPNYDKEYVQRRIKKQIFLRGLTPNDENGRKVVNENIHSYRDIRLVPMEKYNFPNEVNIYDDKIAITSFNEKEPIGLIIKDHHTANTHRSLFEMGWQLTKQNTKKWT